METIEQWKRFEITLDGPTNGNPYTDVNVFAVFTNRNHEHKVRGFYNGDGTYKIRYMPQDTGEWFYKTNSNSPELNNKQGQFNVKPATEGNHGPVIVKNKTSFSYADGTPYTPVGTTAYAWAWQPENVQNDTLNTLKKTDFNKIRMTVFPKYYNYNTQEPSMYPFKGNHPQTHHPYTTDDWWVKKEDIKFDFTQFNPKWFEHLEKQIDELDKLGIEADLILFHPYDHWGFARMGMENNKRYLKYIVARLASFKNVWWSMANEYDLMDDYKQIRLGEWDDLCKVVYFEDPSQHLLSIHNYYNPPIHHLKTNNWYDYSKPWITHISVQNYSYYMAVQWQEEYKKPVIFDEFRYEGNIEMGWGNRSAEGEVDGFWKLMSHGAYGTHGETLLDKPQTDRPIWWAHGGKLHGESYKRIGFMRKLFEANNLTDIVPIGIDTPDWELYAGASRDNKHIVIYFGDSQPRFENIPFLPNNEKYSAKLINAWSMTQKPFKDELDSTTWFELPKEKYQALILTLKED